MGGFSDVGGNEPCFVYLMNSSKVYDIVLPALLLCTYGSNAIPILYIVYMGNKFEAC